VVQKIRSINDRQVRGSRYWWLHQTI
jgi:hypothetical protein